MDRARRRLARTAAAFRADRSGAVAVEYGLLISLIVVGMLVGLGIYRDSVAAVFDSFAGHFN